jgi:hypothetical protein
MPLVVTPDTLSLAARRLYEQWEHLEVDGASEGYPWATLAAALAAPIDPLYDLLSGAEHPWAPAFDPELAGEVLSPQFAEALLAYLGQFAGVRRREDLPPLGQRIRITETGGARRGSPAAIVGAARQHAIGPDGTPDSATVILVERIGGDPYHFAVTMYASEVADAAATVRDIEEQTPAGRRGTDPADRFDFNLVTGGNFATLSASWATFGDVSAAFATFGDVTENPSGT